MTARVDFIKRMPAVSMSWSVKIYWMWAAGLSLLYLASPIVSYLIFLELIPEVPLMVFFGGLLVPTFMVRLWFLLTGQLRFLNRESLFSFILLVWVSILQLLWYPIVSAWIDPSDVLSTLALTFVIPWLLWLGGESLAYLLHRESFTKIIVVVYLSLSCAVIYGIWQGYNLYGLLIMALQKQLTGEFYNSYIPLADSLAIVGLLLMGTRRCNNVYVRLGVYITTAVLLIFTFSRAAFLTFVGVGLAFLWVSVQFRQKRQILGFILGAGIIILMLSLIMTDIPRKTMVYLEGVQYLIGRVRSLLAGTDNSFQLRSEFLTRGMESLKRHWLLGAFMNEAIEGEGKGTYIHNWLSFWISYGIGPFLLSLWCLVRLLIKSWKARRNSCLSHLAFGLVLFCFVAVVAARSYIWPYIWFALGFAGVASSTLR
ncbi:MAG: O-antigen ligase family protein [Anaerolineales bacterium]|nr:O-antigen ligase family protein [Anaerolineales bacterium]